MITKEYRHIAVMVYAKSLKADTMVMDGIINDQ